MKTKLSVVAPCYNEEEILDIFVNRLTQALAAAAPAYELEIILIDDGSQDATWEGIKRLSLANPAIKGLSLSRNFGHQNALACGYMHATGDVIVSIDSDLQDPPELISDMLRQWENGSDIVLAVRKKRDHDSFFKKKSADLYYGLLQSISNVHIVRNCGDFRLISRKALTALNTMSEFHKFIRGMISYVGFRVSYVYYDRPIREKGTTKYSLRKMLALAMDGITSFSVSPLMLVFFMSFFMMILGLLFVLYILAAGVFTSIEITRGWTSLALLIIAFGSISSFSTGIVGIYVGKVYEQSKHRPNYIVNEVINL